MTYGIRNLVGVATATPLKKGWEFGLDTSSWPSWASTLADYAFFCHWGHALDFALALLSYLVLWPRTFPHAGQFADLTWVGEVVAFNLAAEFLLYGGAHWMMYRSQASKRLQEKGFKYNPELQYAPGSGHLGREVLFTTLGWLQSSLYQVAVMHLWATQGQRFPMSEDFWARPGWVVAQVALVTYWREFHFYWVHRFIHPWKLFGVLPIGDFLYRHVHSLHHKSYNPGPFSGLAMHPVEHLLYYTCTLLPLAFPASLPAHPLCFLYAKHHADVAPIGGHDGYEAPGGGGEHHYLHHAKFECNYGVPLIDFDRLFGTWVDYSAWLAAGKDMKRALAMTQAGVVGEKAKALLQQDGKKAQAEGKKAA